MTYDKTIMVAKIKIFMEMVNIYDTYLDANYVEIYEFNEKVYL